MWGPGAEQGGIIQASSCKLDLKEPYYRMSQPQAYPLSQDQQPHQLINTQVLTNPTSALAYSHYKMMSIFLDILTVTSSGLKRYCS